MPSKADRSWLDEADHQSNRHVDLQIDFIRYKSGTHIARFGGRWDSKYKTYIGDAPTSVVIEVHAQQITAVELFDEFVAAQMAGGDRATDNQRIREIIEGDVELDAETGKIVSMSELFLSGGRRSGKTYVGSALINAYAVAVPNAICWTVAPNESLFYELHKKVHTSMLPTDWYEYLGDPKFEYLFKNGSIHTLLSGHKATNLKRGNSDVVLVNEAQQINADSYRNVRGAAIDDGGLTICALNPPTLGDVGEWTSDAVAKTETGDRVGARHLFVDPLDNPRIDLRPLLNLRQMMTEHDFETQIRGKFLAHPGSVLYAWDRSENERRAPDIGDCTTEFVTAHEGDRAKWQHIVSIDVQSFPFIAVGIFKAYRDPRRPLDPKAALLWAVGELSMFQADEHDVAIRLREIVDPKTTLLIMDASCFWQQMQRDLMKQRPEFRNTKGGSATIFKQLGFKYQVKPDRYLEGNPDVLERIRATQMAIKQQMGIRGLYVDPKCRNIIESATNWRMKHGKPSRRQNAAHFGDVLGYAVWRFFPRRGNARNVVDALLDTPPTGTP